MTDSQLTPEQMQEAFHERLSEMQETQTTEQQLAPIDWKRYRKLRWFILKVAAHFFFHDMILNRPGLNIFRTATIPRWRKIARNFRDLALDMSGLLIKLGQFLSTRVDILPPAVTKELAGLQDTVPPVPFDQVVALIEADFRQPIDQIFGYIDPQPLGAASLSQAHAACLPNGERVVVKILLPNIDSIVETDLAGVALALRLLKYYREISKRVNLDWLSEEFIKVTRAELNYAAEGKNAEQFAQDFADDPQVYIPKIYWEYSAERTLTLEDVGYIKIGDLRAIEAAGINRADIARRFYEIFMTECFVTNFVHADPIRAMCLSAPCPHPTRKLSGICPAMRCRMRKIGPIRSSSSTLA